MENKYMMLMSKLIMCNTKNILNKNWFPPFLCFAILCLKCCLFHWVAFHSILISSLWKDPCAFWAFYLPKISISLFLASFLCFTKRKWWMLIVMFGIDAWIIANLCYFRLNGLLIDMYALSMVGNMKGFWGSSLFLLRIVDVWFPITTILCIYPLIRIKSISRSLRLGFISVICACLMNFCGMLCHAKISYNRTLSLYEQYAQLNASKNAPKYRDFVFCNPFSHSARAKLFFDASKLSYEIENLSILHSLGIDLADWLYTKSDTYTMTADDIDQMQSCIGHDCNCRYEHRMILILIESLEEWAIHPNSMPNLYNFVQTNNHILYVPKIASQIHAGSSSDGQLIINTGMLPVKQGAAVFRFPLNRYPAFSQLAVRKAVTILPHPTDVWNQRAMSPAYGYDTTMVCDVKDEMLFAKVIETIQQGYQVVQVLTVLSHAPFNGGVPYSHLQTNSLMPTMMSDYLKCMHYTDESLAPLLQKVKTDSLFQQTTIVITGDHTIFAQDNRDEFEQYCQQSGDVYNVQNAYSALVVYSPMIKEKMLNSDISYQMDIYPTILDVMGCRDYLWRGLGRSLLHPEQRPISIDSAWTLSDKIIRSNYMNEILPVCD